MCDSKQYLKLKKLIILTLIVSYNAVLSQEPGCPNVLVSEDIMLNCNNLSTVNLSAEYIELGKTTTYDVEKIEYNPPFSFSGLSNPVSVGVDDVWSPTVTLPFNFCFYGNMYKECVISSNGVISFNTSVYKPGDYSQWYIGNSIPSSDLFLNSIFSVYHDMEPSLGGEIAYEILGEAPCRKLVVSYYDVPMYLCSNNKSNFQIVLYETTNIIEVYIKEKSVCEWWNNGNAVLGIQNADGTQGVSPKGRNTSVWAVDASNSEAWRFVPSGEAITSIKWYDTIEGGNVISESNNIIVAPSLTTDYRAEVLYMMCDGSQIIKSDTVSVVVNECPSTIDFDGNDDFINVNSLIDIDSELTLMAWVKLDDSTPSYRHIMGEHNFKISLNTDNRIEVNIKTNTGNYMINSLDITLDDKWNHITSTFNGEELKLFIDGVNVNNISIDASRLVESSTDFFIGKDCLLNENYFSGSIQEVKVFRKALTINQIREQVFQPIKNINGKVYGTITNKEISEGLLWGDLKLYLKLTQAIAGSTPDNSPNTNNAFLHNMTTSQITSAPLPYIANQSGEWLSDSVWKNGNEINISKMTEYDWAIVKLTNNAIVTTDFSHTYLGLLVDLGAELVVLNNQFIESTNYLKIDGKIDLVGESQLIQTENSTLDVASSGYIERDQKGKSNLYSFNLWSSPVSLSNTLSNNINFNVSGVLKDGSDPSNPLDIVFDSLSLDGASTSPITIADYWIYTFINMPESNSNWSQIRSEGSIEVGQGFTMKGTGALKATQNYVFSGKPNNGIIQHRIDAESLYLIGNPYLSTLNANTFIEDNIGVNGSINGALYFLNHSGGVSHELSDYEVGYATYNLLGSTKAIYQPEISSSENGLLKPSQFIPVAQGFFVKGDRDGGIIKFNNSQRIFKTEKEDNSIFIKSSKSTTKNNKNIETDKPDSIDKIFFRFTTPEGAERELLLGIKNGLTTNFDLGYDADRIDEALTDCAWLIEKSPCVIQGVGAIFNDLELPLLINVGVAGIVSFSVNNLTSLPVGIDMFLKDIVLNELVKFEVGSSITRNLSTGVFSDRFFVVFKSNVLSNTTKNNEHNDLIVYYDDNNKNIIVKPYGQLIVQNIKIYNVLGQKINTNIKVKKNIDLIEITTNLSSGVYFLNIVCNDKQIFKKILIP